MDKYEVVKDLGTGNFGVARLLRHKETKELVAMKYIERGRKMDKYEVVKDLGTGNFGVARLLRHKETKELVAMKYIERGRKARYFFQQLICGVDYCHSLQICHRDLKLENTLLDGSPAPLLKICDFGYSKSSILHSRPKSTVGTPAYIAPEVLSRREYDGKHADVWSCGVTLYVMLVGAYPFEDPNDPKNFRKTIQRIMAIQYKIPDYVHISQECKHLLSRIFVTNPAKVPLKAYMLSWFKMAHGERITLKEIKNHPWYLKNLPKELLESAQAVYYKRDNTSYSLQSVEDIMKIVGEARNPASSSSVSKSLGSGVEEEEDVEAEVEEEEEEEEDEEDEYEKHVKEAHSSIQEPHEALKEKK
ncbi:hypothetical protein DY000_02019455 [Brassica cretica]|uniref:Protein kinase domain-containing protein n=1 Tax=Brassica cretica TaxID=69181 RepID=A0ABQ7DDG7_BRACR|nr:hypothetical protein DY000_02019455 [Brassica cretica]